VNPYGQPRRKLPVEAMVSLYVERQWPSDKIAKHFGCSPPTVLNRLREAGVAVRHHNDTKRGAPSPRRHVISEAAAAMAYLYRPTASVSEIARLMGCHRAAVDRAIDVFGIPRKSLSQVIEGKRNGAANPNWREDLTAAERLTRRDMAAQARWRLQVYERDRFACVRCDDATGGNLNAHHVESHNANRALRWQVSNGATLCESCHIGFHKRFGYGNNTAAQFAEYLQPERLAA